MTKNYSEKDIKLLSDRDHVRLRLPMYAGNITKTTYRVPIFIDNKIEIHELEFCPAALKCVNEVIDNSLDEYSQHLPKNPLLTINANPCLGSYQITDIGRGVPIGKHESGKFTPEVVFGSLRSGRNFTNDKSAGVIGLNGIGASMTNFCSVEFSVDIKRDGKRYRQTFSNGAENTSKPNIRRTKITDTGTSIEFQLDGEVFEDTSLPTELLENRAMELALTNPGLLVQYNDKKFKFKKGFEDIIKKNSSNYYKFSDKHMEYFVIFDLHEGNDEKIFTWVNSSLMFDGGISNNQFLNSLYDKVIDHLSTAAKKEKCEISKSDIRSNLFVIGNLQLSNPEFDSQSKTRLAGPNLRKEINALIDANWTSFTRKHKQWLDEVLGRAAKRYHAHKDKKAVKEHQKKLRKKVPGLVDASNKNRFETRIFITEGLSAAANIIQVRDPKIHASFPLSGKINNVYGTTVSQILTMGKITDLITAIGLIPGQRALRGQLNFGKIIISTDADVDGGAIFNLLINLFYQFWPELLDPNYEPIIFRLVTPNIIARKGKQKQYFATREEFEKVKSKYENWNLTYLKGLGSLSKEDYEQLINNDKYLLPIVDDGNIKDTLTLLFSNNADMRKNWLQGEEL